jgi:5-methyltetrahydrofolate--homocysteine methyltransferase
VDSQDESVLSFASAVGDLDEVNALENMERLAGEGMRPRDVHKALELGMRIVDGKYRRGEYFIADRLYADRLYARIMEHPLMVARPGDAGPAPSVVLTSLPGDFHDAGNEAAAAALRAYGFSVIYAGLGVPAEAFGREAAERDVRIAALLCTRPQASDELACFSKRLRAECVSLEYLVAWGNDAFASTFRNLGADAYAEDALALVDYCLARRGERSR